MTGDDDDDEDDDVMNDGGTGSGCAPLWPFVCFRKGKIGGRNRNEIKIKMK